MGRDQVLFIGNGINRLSDDGTSWEGLLNEIASMPRTQHEVEVRNAKPFTLWFEEMSSQNHIRGLKEWISDYLENSIKANDCHEAIINLNFEHIITTNYDYVLENCSAENWESNNSAKETYYSLFRRHTSRNKNIWHIHGELNTPSTIMLGHDQYIGYTQRAELNRQKIGGEIPLLSKG